GGHVWELWFRDLPCKGPTFDRALVLSTLNQDVNDPEGRSRDFEAVGGYEWRLAEKGIADGALARKLFGLDFFPLTFEKVVFQGDELAEVQIMGRLQLPTGTIAREDVDISNAVRLTFKPPAPGSGPALSDVALVSPQGEWALAEGVVGSNLDTP